MYKIKTQCGEVEIYYLGNAGLDQIGYNAIDRKEMKGWHYHPDSYQGELFSRGYKSPATAERAAIEWARCEAVAGDDHLLIS